MWDLGNHTKFAAEGCVVVDKHGARHWVVVVKGTFDIAPDGTTQIADEQVEVKAAPEYAGEPGSSSLLYEFDFTLEKPRTDIVVNGSAHAPNGQPCTEMAVGLQTPNGNKSLVVRGDRVWERNLMGLVEPSPPKPFVTMPITYERAFGGYDKDDPDPEQHRLYPHNPIGTGFFTSANHRVGKPLPNVEYANSGNKDKAPPGFGAVCSYWEPRLSYQGTYDAQWVEKRRPLLPEDFDPLNLQCAPQDQQIEPHLRGGSVLGVVGMTPSGSLRFEVPKHYLAFQTQIGKKSHEHRAKISTVIIEPDHPRVIVVWHTMLACHHQIDDLDHTEISEKTYI